MLQIVTRNENKRSELRTRLRRTAVQTASNAQLLKAPRFVIPYITFLATASSQAKKTATEYPLARQQVFPQLEKSDAEDNRMTKTMWVAGIHVLRRQLGGYWYDEQRISRCS